MATIDDFKKIELRAARVLEASRVEGSDKLLKLRLGLGGEERQVISGIGKAYEPEFLAGKILILAANLEPRMLMGLESQGMILAAHDAEGKPVVLVPEKPVADGAGVS